MTKTFFGFFAAIVTVLAFTVSATAQSSYKIRTGDTLQIEVFEDQNLNRSALVLPGGTISFPFVGSVSVAGRTVGDVANALATGLSRNFASTPNVFVSVAEVGVPPVARATAPRASEIYITGEVANPGQLEKASRNITILQAIAQAGGLTKFAASKRVQLRRGDKIYPYNYETNGGAGSIPGSTRLAPGDVIVVPQRKLFE